MNRPSASSSPEPGPTTGPHLNPSPTAPDRAPDRARAWRRWAAGPRAGVVLTAIALLAFLPGFFSIPPVDRDESRFAQASRQMFESAAFPRDRQDLDPATGAHRGGLVVPMVQGRERLNKPPLIYWLQAASAWALTAGEPARDAIWMYRVPSLLAALVSVLATWRLGVSMFDARAAWLAGLLLAVAPVFAWEARQARADQVLVAATTLAMWALWRVFRAGPGRVPRLTAVALWLAVAIGVLTKGPITPMVVGLAALALTLTTRRAAWLLASRPLLGLGLVLACVAPWVIAVGQHVGWDRYRDVLYDEVIARSAGAKEGHWGPPGYHLVALCALFWPGVLLTGAGVARGLRRAWGAREPLAPRAPVRAARGRRAELFLLAWVVPSWLVFELVGTKLPHYTMPLYPALALLSARAVMAASAGSLAAARARGARLGYAVWVIVGGAFILLPAAALAAAGTPLAWALGLVVLAVGGWLLYHAARDTARHRFLRAQAWGIGAALLSIAALLGVVAPHALALSQRLARELDRLDPDARRPVAAVGYHEDSLVFHTRGRLARLTPESLDAWARQHPDALLVVPRFTPGPGMAGDHALRARVVGWNYSKGDVVSLVIVDAGAWLAQQERDIP